MFPRPFSYFPVNYYNAPYGFFTPTLAHFLSMDSEWLQILGDSTFLQYFDSMRRSLTFPDAFDTLVKVINPTELWDT